MAAFGREAGPAAAPLRPSNANQTVRFGTNPPPSSSPSPSFPPPSSWVPEAVERVRSPPLAYDSTGFGSNSYQSSGVPRRVGAPTGVRSPSLPYENKFPPGKPHNPSVGAPKVIESPYIWVNGQRPIPKVNGQSNSGPYEAKSFVASHNAGANLTAKITRFQDLQTPNFSFSHSIDEEIPRGPNLNSLQSQYAMVNHNGTQPVPSRTRSPPLASQKNKSSQFIHPSVDEGQPPALPSAWHDHPEMPGRSPHFRTHEDRMLVPYSDLYNSGSSFGNEVDVQVPKRSKSPPVPPFKEPFQENTHILQQQSMRPSISPPRLSKGSPSVSSSSDALNPLRPLQSMDNAVTVAGSMRSSSFAAAKRSRSPVSAAGETFPENLFRNQDDTERELQAKAKRLARFKNELSDDLEDGPNTSNQSLSMVKYEQSKIEGRKSSEDLMMESVGEFTHGNASSDYEGLETTSIITGLCPDMCPELERAERERKGDLDQYERLDGDRNQTNKFLAVKKYNRTAEREAILIRPMPVLQKTIAYLLNLLDKPYDDKFLGIYNFLWDRMRAIRMDLRMQHIFNQDSITMLEQMIRLHIIAMHELCEYNKGEGFSEGFDSHLNIEQMNKASVELFQMYDDHRKKGATITTEKEFRGYYALLKLDKHPGYKVEPAELSLDLAKMTPEIRQTPEVLFARSVARACRTGNFIAFFRLARKASYLQACLMHAHFAKVRTQALESLHSGLLINQGLPVACVAEWLAMEEEDVESLLEYYGFSIKEFEEPYMVKEGQFLYDAKDYPTSCSKLVCMKRSRRIVEDVSPTIPGAPVIVKTREIQTPKMYKYDTKPRPSPLGVKKIPFSVVDEEMPDVQVTPSSKVGLPMQPQMKEPLFGQWTPDGHLKAGEYISPSGFPLSKGSFGFQPAKAVVEKLNMDAVSKISPVRKILSGIDVMTTTAFHGISPGVKQTEVFPSPITTKVSSQVASPKSIHGSNVENPVFYRMSPKGHVENPVCEAEIVNDLEDEELTQDIEDEEENEVVQDYEVALAKIKLIFRLWRRRCAKLRMLREQRHIVAEVALGSLSLGPLVQHQKDRKHSTTAYEFDIDHVMRERDVKRQKSWSQLNISEVVGNILCRRNPHAKCLCWKIILCPQVYPQSGDASERGQNKQKAASVWLKSKIMPSKPEDTDKKELLVSSPSQSIWAKWIPALSGEDTTCCFSVVKDVGFGNLNETLAGAGGLLFVTPESIPWNVQRVRLHDVLMSIPYGASLPLLVLSGLRGGAVSNASAIIIGELGLYDIDKSRVSCFSVCFLGGDEQVQEVDEFLSDKQLRDGLEWLASESPLQPDLRYIKTRELVLFHLNPSLDAVEKTKDCNLGPDHCISAFNEAVDLSLSEITATAEANCASWPCPEINLLEDYLPPEFMIAMRELPGIGWSSADKIEPLLKAVRSCKLPSFADAGCQWDDGTNKDIGIEDLILQLESLLIKYLTESSGMMAFQFAAKEAHVMVQRSSRLELHNLSYTVVPNWILIFRRIFNWRLMNLSIGPYSSAYVKRTNHLEASRVLDEHRIEESVPHLSWPSLDETIHVSCSPPSLGRDWLRPEALRTSPLATSNGDVQVAVNVGEFTKNERSCGQSDALLPKGVCRSSEVNTANDEVIFAGRPKKEAARLSTLLEKCNIIQKSIDEKLSIYF